MKENWDNPEAAWHLYVPTEVRETARGGSTPLTNHTWVREQVESHTKEKKKKKKTAEEGGEEEERKKK